jgi:hypothetical protein
MRSVFFCRDSPSLALSALAPPQSGSAHPDDARRQPANVGSGTGAGSRTLTPLRAADFKSAASAIPPLRHAQKVSARRDTWGGRARGYAAQLREGKVEATSGIEPLNRGFADPPLNHLGTSPRTLPPLGRFRRLGKPASWWVRLAAPRGFEPRQTDSKSAVLPLDEGAETQALAGGRPDRQH